MEQGTFKHMPEPAPEPEPEPEPPEPMWISARIEVRLRVRADIASLAYQNRLKPTHLTSSSTEQPLDYDALNEEWLRANTYQPHERGAVFLWNAINETLDVFVGRVHGLIEEEAWSGGDTEIEFDWTDQQQRELDERLGGH